MNRLRRALAFALIEIAGLLLPRRDREKLASVIENGVRYRAPAPKVNPKFARR